MLKRRQLLVGGMAVAGAGGAAWLYYRSRASYAFGGGPFRHDPFDPVAAENFQQKLFIPVASGPSLACWSRRAVEDSRHGGQFPAAAGPCIASPVALYPGQHFVLLHAWRCR